MCQRDIAKLRADARNRIQSFNFLNDTRLQIATFCASAAHVPECTLALRFSNVTIFAHVSFKNSND